MRRSVLIARKGFLIGVALATAMVVLVLLSIERYRQPPPAAPEILELIAAKNRDAAVSAAAVQRAESAASTEAIENLAKAGRRGSDEANATLARYNALDDEGGAGNRH